MSIGVCVQFTFTSAKDMPRFPLGSNVVAFRVRRSVRCKSEIAGAANQEVVGSDTFVRRRAGADNVTGEVGSALLFEDWCTKERSRWLDCQAYYAGTVTQSGLTRQGSP